MINKVQSDPEAIHVATDYKKIGKSFELNRQRVVNVVYSISRTTNEAQKKRIDEIISDKAVTDSEKITLSRELDALIRDFDYLTTETRNAELGTTDEYMNTKESYDRLVELLSKIVNSVGVYDNIDVTYLTDYYNDYTAKTKILERLILDTTAQQNRIEKYSAMVSLDINIYPEAVPAGGSATVSAMLFYEGEDKIDDVDPDDISFGITGLDSGVTSSMFTIPTGGTLRLYPLTNSAEIEGCTSFEIDYDALGSSDVQVNCSVVLDSDSMPF